MEDFKWWEKFESYYRKEMSSKEKMEFEAALKGNPELNEQFEEYLRVANALSCMVTRAKLAANPEFRKAIAIDSNNRNRKPFFRKWGLALLAIAFVVFFSLWWFILRPQAIESSETPATSVEMAKAEHMDYRQIAIEFAGKRPFDDGMTRGGAMDSRTNSLKEVLDKCHVLLSEGEFAETIEFMKNHPELTQRSEFTWIFGLSYLGKGEISKALVYIEEVADNRFNDYFSIARELQTRLTEN
ncbi:MAG: hypothetical protein EA409_10375 [Saprospirales bacterium]|nr:MAG: hypothetical protein EA409_10375 [Saprospirales bacterium]